MYLFFFHFMFQSLFQVHREVPERRWPWRHTLACISSAHCGLHLPRRPVPTGTNEEGAHPAAFPSLLNPFNEVSFRNKVGFYFLFFIFLVHDTKYSNEEFFNGLLKPERPRWTQLEVWACRHLQLKG